MGKSNKKKYSDDLKSRVVELINSSYSITKASEVACEEFGIKYNDTFRRHMSWILEDMGITNNVTKELEDSDAFKTAQTKEHDSSKKRFIVSWCQSETEINHKFLDNIESYAAYIDAEILIVAGRYKNPTSLSTSESIKNKENVIKNTWHKRVLPYLDAKRHKIHKHLELLSDVKIQPTASTPLSGLNSLTGLESCILGHPRVHLKSLPVLDGYPHKLLLTTGAVSVNNYTDTKVGKKSEFHHTFGFVVVELDGDNLHMRQVTASSDGSFYDLKYFIKNREVSFHTGASAIVFGDLHLGETNEYAFKTSYEMASDLNCLDNIILHDVADFHSISHHELSDPIALLKREDDGTNSLKKELESVKDFFNEFLGCNFTVVKSNHCAFIDRWIGSNDWRKSNNKRMYLELAYNLMNDKEGKGVLPMYLKLNDVKNANCLGINDSYRVNNWELAIHGHLGTNGSRGGSTQFKSLNTKLITGHSHTCERIDNLVTVGTLTNLRMNYNNGLSSWNHANAIVYPNGKSQLIIINKNNYKYTTL